MTANRLGAFLVAVTPLIYFFPAVRGKLVLAPDDGIIFNAPLRAAAANILRAGYLPLWNPYIFSGIPLHASAQAGLLFPLNWIYLVLSAPVATNIMMLASYSLAGLGAYLYARRAGANIAGSIATGLIWQWSSFLVNQISHTNIVQTAGMLPWVLWAVDGYGKTGRRWGGALLAMFVALQAFAGHQQTFAYALLLTSAYAVTMAFASRENRINYLRSIIFIIAGFVLAAVQILPTFELLRNSPRATATYDFFSSFSMPPHFVLTVVAPYLMGGGDGKIFRAHYLGPSFYSEYAVYIGVTGFMLSLLAVWLRRDARTKFWAVAALVCLVLAFGRYAPLRLYELIYQVPLLNLFRVHARHLMEVDFALAVLAGRGLTALHAARRNALLRRKATRTALIAGLAVLLLTVIVVTRGRPSDFTLGRQAPVSFLRAPELFMPVVFAALGAWAIWHFARARRGASVILLLVLALDLAVWGQSSGWRVVSPEMKSELWGQPDTVKFLRERVAQDEGKGGRILTQDQPFDPDVPVAAPSPDKGWVATLQPDIYMMYGIENAAGYDGFGLTRYSQLAGDMKVWGELENPERTLLAPSRELDILNVRYLLTRPLVSSPDVSSKGPPSLMTVPPSAPETYPPAIKSYRGERFASDELKMPSLGPDARLLFAVPAVKADRIALLTNLTWSVDLPDRTPVAHLKLRTDDGRTFDYDLRVGVDTSEWAYDRPDIRKQIKSARATVATSYGVADAQGKYQGHTYISVFKLPEKATVVSGEITVTPNENAPDLSLGLFGISLEDGDVAFPVRRELIRKESGSGQLQPSENSLERWRRVAKLDKVSVFENTRALPRAWLASNVQILSDSEILSVIRTGDMPDGSIWDPRQTALVEAAVDFSGGTVSDPGGQADLLRHEPSRVVVQTASQSPAILMLSENDYPGWRAYVDGRTVEILRVNYNLRGVVLQQGNHVVEFVYRPYSVMIGLLLSLFVFVLLVLWAAGFLSRMKLDTPA